MSVESAKSSGTEDTDIVGLSVSQHGSGLESPLTVTIPWNFGKIPNAISEGEHFRVVKSFCKFLFSLNSLILPHDFDTDFTDGMHCLVAMSRML